MTYTIAALCDSMPRFPAHPRHVKAVLRVAAALILVLVVGSGRTVDRALAADARIASPRAPGSAAQRTVDAPGGPSLRVALFTTTSADNTYWPEVHALVRATAESLGIGLEIHEFDVLDRFALVPAGVERLRTEPRLDAAVFSLEFRQALPLMNAAEESGIPFYVHGPLFPDELEALGSAPGRAYRYWLGYFHEDEELKGYWLAQRLIAAAREARSPDASETIFVAGISGSRSWFGSHLREAGLRRAISEHPDVALVQMVYTRWTPHEGRVMASELLRRYPHITVLWAASDQLAIGAADTIRSRASESSARIVTGGLDLSSAGIEAVLVGDLVATVAGSSLLWAQVVVDLFDHLHGLGHRDDPHTVLLGAPLVADGSTAAMVRDSVQGFESLDFRQYSRALHGDDAPRLDDLMSGP